MKAQLTQEAKDALLASIEERILKLEKERTPNYGSVCVGITECVEAIKSFPTSSNEGISVSEGCKPNASANGKPNPTDNWIPCSERLPEKNKVVLVSANDGEVWLSENDGEFGWHGESTGQLITNWQPLPNPPNKRRE